MTGSSKRDTIRKNHCQRKQVNMWADTKSIEGWIKHWLAAACARGYASLLTHQRQAVGFRSRMSLFVAPWKMQAHIFWHKRPFFTEIELQKPQVQIILRFFFPSLSISGSLHQFSSTVWGSRQFIKQGVVLGAWICNVDGALTVSLTGEHFLPFFFLFYQQHPPPPLLYWTPKSELTFSITLVSFYNVHSICK